MCNDIISRTSITTLGPLAIWDLAVCVVWIWILENDIPGVEETGKETETAEREVYQRVGAADPLLNPYTNRRETVSSC